jgi:hypothetical protein
MFSMLADGQGRYRLVADGGADAGWIRGKSIGFHGVRNEADAIEAASIGWRTLQALVHRGPAAGPREVVVHERLRLVHDGAYEWVSDGRVPLARLLRSSQPGAHGHDAIGAAARAPRRLAIEFVVPSWVAEHDMIPLAHALWRALTPLLGKPSRRSARILAAIDDAPTGYPPAARLHCSLQAGEPKPAA